MGVPPVNLSTQQDARKALINSVINELESQLNAVPTAAKDNIELRPELYDLFDDFDTKNSTNTGISGTKSITGSEIENLINNLKDIVKDNASVINLFNTDGSIKLSAVHDYNRDGLKDIKDADALNKLLEDKNANKIADLVTSNSLVFNRETLVNSLSSLDEAIYTELTNTPGVSDEDEAFFLLNIAGKPVDQRLKDSYLNIFKNGTVSDAKIGLLKNFIDHQTSGNPKATSDYIDLFILNYDHQTNLTNANNLVNILKSTISNKNTFISSLEAISRNGENQSITQMVLNTFTSTPSNLGSGINDTEASKFNALINGYSLNATDRDNYYKIITSSNPSTMVLDEFEVMFTSNRYSQDKSNLLLTINNNASHPLRTTGTLQDYFKEEFRASTNFTNANNIHNITATNRANYNNSLINLYNYNKSPLILSVLSSSNANGINLETALNTTKIDQLTQFINDKTGESATDQNRYLRYISLSTPLPANWLDTYEGMFADPGKGITSTYSTDKANLFDSAVNNSILRNSTTYGTQFLDYFKTAGQYNYADALNSLTSKYAASPATRDNYVNSLKLASEDPSMSSKIALALKRDAGTGSLSSPLSISNLDRFKTLYLNSSTPTADEDALLEAIKRNANTEIVDAFLTEFTATTRASDTERNTFINAIRSPNINANADYRKVYLEAFNTNAGLAQIVIDIANSTLSSKANYDLSIKTISNNMASGENFDITTGLSTVLSSLNSLRSSNINISRGLDQTAANNFDSFSKLSNTSTIHENRYLKYLLGDENTNTPAAADDALWASKYRAQFTNAAISTAQLNSRESLIETAFYTGRLNSVKNNTDLFFQMLDTNPASATIDNGFIYADNLQKILAHNGTTAFTQSVRDTYVTNLEKSFEMAPPMPAAMANLLRRQALASNTAVKVFSDAEIEQFRTIIDKGASEAQQDLLFRAISTNKDQDLINAYVNAFVDGSINSDTSTNKTQLFADAIDSSINNNGDLQDLFLYAYKKDTGDRGAISARKIADIARTTGFTNNATYISILEKIDQNLSTVAKGSGFEEIINALSSNHTKRSPLNRVPSNADISRFDDFSFANWTNSPSKINPDPIDEERFLKYLLTDRIAEGQNRRDDWVTRYETLYKSGVATAAKSDLFDDAFENPSTYSSVKYSNMFLNMIDDDTFVSYIYAKTLNGIKPPSSEFSGLTRSTNPSKDKYIDSLQKIYEYNPPLSKPDVEKITKILERHISTNYQTNYVLDNSDIDRFKVLFSKGASVEQQDLLFRALSENKDRDLIDAYVAAFTDGSISSDTDVSVNPMPSGFTAKTILFQRAINSNLINNNGDLQNLFIYAYSANDGKSSKQAEQILNIVETNDPNFSANTRYISSLEAISKKTANNLANNVAKGSGFTEIMDALSANHNARTAIDRAFTAADIDRFDTFNNLNNENSQDRSRFIKYQLTNRSINGQNQANKWLNSFEKMFLDNDAQDPYVNDPRRQLFDDAYHKGVVNGSLDYTDTFIEMFDRTDGYEFANSLVRVMVDSTSSSKDKYIDNLERAAELAIPKGIINLLERQLAANVSLNRIFNNREFDEYKIMFNATDVDGNPIADNDDIDKLFKMHTYNPNNDSGIDNDLEAAFAKMFQDGTINIGKTATTPSTKEALLDRLLPDALSENDSNKINLINKVQVLEEIVDGVKITKNVTYTAEQQQLDFLKYFNQDQYMNFAKDLILDYFITSYKNPSPLQEATLVNNFGTGTEAELVKKIRSGTIINASQFKNEFTALAPNGDLNALITKIADITANGIPVDKVTGEQRLIFAETFAAILAIDNSTPENVANGTANNIARDYIPSLNNMFALNADDKLVRTLKRFAETGRKFEAWMTAEDIEIFSDIAESPYFLAQEEKFTDLYVEMALSLKSLTPEEKNRKDNFREAFKDIFLYAYPTPTTYNNSDPIFSNNMSNVDDKMKILESLINGLDAPDSLYLETVLDDPNSDNNPALTADEVKSEIKLLSKDEASLLNYLSAYENTNYPLSHLNLINIQRDNSSVSPIITSDTQLESAIRKFNNSSATSAEKTAYTNHINYIDDYSGINGFDLNAKNNNIDPKIAELTANILKASKYLINFPGETFNQAASILEKLSMFTLNSGSSLKDSATNLNTTVSNWINDITANPIYKDTDLVAKLDQLANNVLALTNNNSVVKDTFTDIKEFTADNQVIGSNIANKNLFAGNKEDRTSKKINTLQDVFNSGNILNSAVKSQDFKFIEQFENIYQKYYLSNEELYNNIVTKFNDNDTKTIVGNVLDALNREEINNSHLSYAERRAGNEFVLNALAKILEDPTQSFFPGSDQNIIISNLSKSLMSNKAADKLYPDAYNDVVFDILLSSQKQLLDKLPNGVEKTEALNLVDAINELPNNLLVREYSSKSGANLTAAKLTDFQNILNNHGSESDIDLLRAYTERSSKGDILANDLKTLIEYEGKSGFRIAARPENLKNSSIEISADLISLAAQINLDASFNNSRLTSLLENSANLILSNSGSNQAFVEEFFRDTALPKINDYLNDASLSATDIDSRIEPFLFIAKGITQFDPELMKAYANLSAIDSPYLDKLESIITYKGSGGFRVNSEISNLTPEQIERASQLINLADELNDMAEFHNSSLVRYLEQSTNLYLKPDSRVNTAEQDRIKSFVSDVTLKKINEILINDELTAQDISELLTTFSLDTESIVSPEKSGYKPFSIRSAEAAGRRLNTGELETRTISNIGSTRNYGTNQVVINEETNSNLRLRNLNENKAAKVQAQIDLYETLRNTLQSLLDTETDSSSAKASSLRDAIDAYTNIIDSLSNLLN